jgi:hypothetical protein
MSHFPALVQSIPAPTSYDLERRASLRHLCNLEAVSHPLDVPEGLCWGAVVKDLSPGGLGLSLCYPFRPGTYLAVDLQAPGTTRTLLARVVHVKDYADGTWFLGCELVKQVAAGEVELMV